MARVTKQQKRDWHKSMRKRACDYSGQICGRCNKHTTVNLGVIHHLSYPSGVYEVDVEALIDQKICMWLCKPCHVDAHFTDDITLSGAGKRNAGTCHLCGKLCYGGWDRAKTLGLTRCICRACHQANKRREEAIKNGQTSFLDDIF
jgi:hypothetical protein